MAHLLSVVFKKDELQKLLDLNPDKIVIRTSLESGKLADRNGSVGYLVVEAEAMKDGSLKPLGTVDGCPIPPCSVIPPEEEKL